MKKLKIMRNICLDAGIAILVTFIVSILLDKSIVAITIEGCAIILCLILSYIYHKKISKITEK